MHTTLTAIVVTIAIGVFIALLLAELVKGKPRTGNLILIVVFVIFFGSFIYDLITI